MSGSRYSARLGDSHRIAEGVAYEMLLKSLVEFTIRAAVADLIDESDWEQERFRRQGLDALQLFRDGLAVWNDRASYQEALIEARREGVEERFKAANVLEPELYERLNRDLLARWRQAGYEAPCLLHGAKQLFTELKRDAAERVAGARESLVVEVLGALFPASS